MQQPAHGVSAKLPEDPDGGGTSSPSGETRILNIGAVHLHASDIDALRRLAEVNPDLAQSVVDQKGEIDRREHASMRLGIIAACFIVIMLLFSITYALVTLGIVLSLLMVFVLVGLAFFVRVLLTGEWSETTWVGQLVKAAISMLGGKPKAPGDE